MAKLYGIGVGPGDPELMTLLAVRLIGQCGVIALPDSGKEVNAAYTIAKGACPDMDKKELLSLSMPMTRDKKTLTESHDLAAGQVIARLERGEDVAFLTIGDPSIYSTYGYIHDRVLQRGYEAQIVPGIPSFCAVSARLNEALTEAHQGLHIIPASYHGVEEALSLPGTRVLMKSGRSIGKIKQLVKEMDPQPEVKMVERCGMEGERVFQSLDEIDENAGYFSILVVKQKQREALAEE